MLTYRQLKPYKSCRCRSSASAGNRLSSIHGRRASGKRSTSTCRRRRLRATGAPSSASWPLCRNGDQLSAHGQTIPGLGDCTAVAAASAIRVLTANRGGEIELTDDQVVGIYEANGYDPARPATDQGAVELDVLNRWCDLG